MAMKKGTFWANGTHIKVAFMGDTATSEDASDFVKAKVQEKAKIWETYANIVFDFVDMSQTPDVRVSFGPDTGSWSYIGTECKRINVANPTMNYGWFNDQTQDDEFERTAVHEFGHALGCTHELQSPSAGAIVWNKQAVYDYYKRNDGWGQAKVDAQVLTPDNPNNDIDTMFDPTSIMCYPIPEGLANVVIGWNKQLSPIDEDFIGESPYFLSYTSRYLIGISETSLPFSCVW
jgi:serralysin